MATISFLVNGTAANPAKAWVTIEEVAGGALLFKVNQIGNVTGNLYGVYFDIEDESILSTLRITGVSDNIRINDEAVNCLKNGTDACQSRVHSDGQKINSYSFILNSDMRALILSDFPHIQLDYSGDSDDSNIKINDDFNHRWLYLELF
ncbi:hypothetical protein R2083_06860 [Nitrosomonas sp. Is35]|uniref:hypothetical protein n=1 Tax=unclassified Nitrosomonas TaxID=2609265 RepID=UPI00294ACD99|nr:MULTISPECIES: hypothetical protein [unclassified Nitrosomonas]MDV6341527.1 hypothetical protein [Nitrosomonas sp. Is24]MDV6347234.1 hypothetical protein [Nitrosomonas sp. Is35]